MKRYGWIALACIAVMVVAAFIELRMGRLLLGPDGKFAWWEGDIWSNEQSQRFADPYSFTHVLHGVLLYAVIWLAARRLPLRYRFLAAVILEAGWEVLENSPFVIDRYRQVTIALGYAGDSVLNSMSDILMMCIGFLVAARLRIWTSVAVVLAIEIGLLLWVRDNLTLNLVMLIHPIQAVKLWQAAGRPLL